MEKYYVDKEGKTIHEAVQLGMSLLRFFSGLSKAKEALFREGSDKGGYFDDFALSLLTENFDIEAFNKNRAHINTLLVVLEGYNKEASQLMREWVYSDFMDVLNNPIMKNEVTKIPMQLLLTEGLMRWINSHVFSGSQSYKNIDIAYANYQCSMHVIAFLAFMCSEDLQNYFKMNIEVESFMYQSSKAVLEG